LSKKTEELIYPKEVSLRAPIKVNPTLKAKAIRKLIEKEAVGNDYYTYSILRHEVSLLVYSDSDIEGLHEAKTLIPITEYLKNYALTYQAEKYCLFVLVDEGVICAIHQGFVEKYQKIDVSQGIEKFIKEVATVQKFLTLDGRDFNLFFSKGVDCLSGKPFDLDDDAILDKIQNHQTIKNPTYSGAGDINLKTGLRHAPSILSVISLIAVVGMVWFFNSKFEVKADVLTHALDEIKVYQHQAIDYVKPKESGEDDIRYSRIHPDDMKAITRTINGLHNEIDQLRAIISTNNPEQKQQVLMKYIETLGLSDAKKKENAQNDDSVFQCETMIKTPNKLICDHNGRSLTLSIGWQRVGGLMVRYVGEKEIIQTRPVSGKKRGVIENLTIAQANRGAF